MRVSPLNIRRGKKDTLETKQDGGLAILPNTANRDLCLAVSLLAVCSYLGLGIRGWQLLAAMFDFIYSSTSILTEISSSK